MPKSFDLKGILGLILQVLGLTYANIRSRAVKILGPKVVEALETGAEIFKTLITEGPAGLWKWIRDKVSALKDAAISSIKDFVITKVITAGVTWIISLLNPASAFIKACKAIYNVVMFFVERGAQIMALVNAILDSIISIAKGNIAGAAAYVESVLAKAVPIVISFLASLLGLGGISEKIKAILEKIREPINAAIDWVINKAVALAKAAGSLLGFGKKTAEGTDPDHDAKVAAGVAALHQEESKYLVDGKLTREGAEKVAATVKSQHPVFRSLTVADGGTTWNYDYAASPAEEEPGKPKEELVFESIPYYVFRLPDRSVKVEYPTASDDPKKIEALIKADATYDAQIRALIEGLGMDRDQAEEFLSKLPVAPGLVAPLLASFARKSEESPPEEFLIKELSSQLTTLRAAVSGLPTAERKATFVYRGEGRESPLADVALVFTQHPKARWTKREHGQKGGPKPAGEPVFHEYVWQGPNPKVIKHGAVRVNASGTVVEILAVPDHIEGGRLRLIELMRKARWPLAPDLT